MRLVGLNRKKKFYSWNVETYQSHFYSSTIFFETGYGVKVFQTYNVIVYSWTDRSQNYQFISFQILFKNLIKLFNNLIKKSKNLIKFLL